MIDDYISKIDHDQSVFGHFHMTYETDRAQHETNVKNVDLKRMKHARNLCKRFLPKSETGFIRTMRLSSWFDLAKEAPYDQRLEKTRMEMTLGRPLAS